MNIKNKQIPCPSYACELCVIQFWDKKIQILVQAAFHQLHQLYHPLMRELFSDSSKLSVHTFSDVNQTVKLGFNFMLKGQKRKKLWWGLLSPVAPIVPSIALQSIATIEGNWRKMPVLTYWLPSSLIYFCLLFNHSHCCFSYQLLIIQIIQKQIFLDIFSKNICFCFSNDLVIDILLR